MVWSCFDGDINRSPTPSTYTITMCPFIIFKTTRSSTTFCLPKKTRSASDQSKREKSGRDHLISIIASNFCSHFNFTPDIVPICDIALTFFRILCLKLIISTASGRKTRYIISKLSFCFHLHLSAESWLVGTRSQTLQSLCAAGHENPTFSFRPNK